MHDARPVTRLHAERGDDKSRNTFGRYHQRRRNPEPQQNRKRCEGNQYGRHVHECPCSKCHDRTVSRRTVRATMGQTWQMKW